MNWCRRSRIRVAVVAVAAGMASLVLLPVEAHDLVAPLHVVAAGRAISVPPGTTVGAVFRMLRAEPRSGDLVSVSGRVLRAGSVPPVFTMDGAAVAPAAPVKDGCVLSAADGLAVRESVVWFLATVGVSGDPVRILPATYDLPAWQLRGSVSGEVLRQKPPSTKAAPAVALTFDDGPGPYTPQVLSILERFGVKATFFVIGSSANREPALVRALHAAGMSVQNHTWNHDRLSGLGPAAVRASLSPVQNLLPKLGVPAPRWVRPPYGSGTAVSNGATASLGLRSVLWSVDALDWKARSPASIAKAILDGVRPGSIVLLHDGGGNRSATVAALPAIIRELQRRGYRFVTLG